MPKDIKKSRILLGDRRYYRKPFPRMARRTPRTVALVEMWRVTYFTPEIGAIFSEPLTLLASSAVLLFPDSDGIENGSRIFRLCCDASTDVLGATLEQAQPDVSIRPIVYLGRATVFNEKHWTTL